MPMLISNIRKLLNAGLSWWRAWAFAMLMGLATLPALIIHVAGAEWAPSITWLCYGTLVLQFSIGTWFFSPARPASPDAPTR